MSLPEETTDLPDRQVQTGTQEQMVYMRLTSKCVTMVSISSSQNGGFASKEPLAGQKDRNGLKTHTYTNTLTLHTVIGYIAVIR